MGVLRYRPAAAVVAVLAVMLQTLALVLATAPAQAAVPLGLQAGDLVISDSGHQRVIVHPADGGPDRVLASGLDTPEDLVVTPAGDVIVADSGRARIMKIPADGGDPEDLNPYQGAWGVTHLALDGAGGVLFSGTGWGGIGRVPLTGGNVTLHVYEPPYPNYAGLGVASDGDIVAVDCCDSSTTRMESDGSDQRPVPELTYDSSADPSETQPRNMSGLIVTPDDRLIVADTWNDLIWETDGTGGRTSYGAGLDEPTSVALGLDNAVYVADSFNNRVVRISPDRSTQTDVLGSPDLLHPSGVAVVPISPEEVGDAFVGTAGGSVERVRGSETVTIATGLDPVTDLVVRDGGEVVVATGDRLVELSGDGSTTSELASFAHPVQALALTPDNDLLAAVDDGSGGTDVRRVSPDGSTAQVDASPIHAFTALTVDDLSETYASFEVAPGNSAVVRTTTPTPPLGGFGLVSGLASEPSGSLVVADGTSGTVHRIATDGTTSVLASGIAGPARLARDLDGDLLVVASGDDELVSVPDDGGSPTTVATIADPVGVAVYVPRPSLAAVSDLPGTGNVGTAYDGYDFDATDNDGGAVTYRAIGDLPPGLTLDPATGELAGTPTTTGDYTFRVQAANQARGVVTDEIEIEVGRRLQSLIFTSTAPTHAMPDDTYTPAVSSDGSGNPVTISIDSGSSTVCSYDSVSGKVTFLIGGLCTILADQAGDSDHEVAPTAHQDVYVDKLAQTVSFTSTAPSGAKVGETYSPSATGGPSANDVTFAITGSPLPPTFLYACSYDAGTGTVTFEHAGTCRLTATKEGDDRYWAGTRSQNITVGVGQLEFISTKPAPGRVGDTYTPAVNAPDASYWIDGGDGDVCSYDSSTGEVSFLASGACEVVADVYSSDYTPDSLRETITVAKQAQGITFTTLPPASAPIGGTYTPAALGGGSGNAVTFSIASSSAGVCSLDSGEVTFDHAGTCVVQADQEEDATYADAETAIQTIEVARIPGSVDITSPPATGVVGQRYTVTATTTAGGGPVDVAVTSPEVCRTDGDDVVLDHAGTCDVEVSWAGDADHEAAQASQTITVSAAPTAVELDVRGRVMVATVSVVAPGAGRPAGVVEFSDGATVLGKVVLDEGDGGAMTAAMVRDRSGVGGQHQITARYVGPADYAGSQDTVAWVDPAITYTVASAAKPSATGWYRAPVTVTFHCTAGTAPILDDCPGPVLLDSNRRAGQSITREVVARDGSSDSVVVTGLRIDLTGPKVRVRGVQPGQTYAAPRKLRCVARDRWSGVDTCVVKTKRKQDGQLIAYRVIAHDRAGNKTVVRGKYRLR